MFDIEQQVVLLQVDEIVCHFLFDFQIIIQVVTIILHIGVGSMLVRLLYNFWNVYNKLYTELFIIQVEILYRSFGAT